MRRLFLIVLICLLGAAGSAAALEPSRTGIILIHGKWGSPGNLSDLSQALTQAGYLVESPAMPWSGSRLYDRGFDQAMQELQTVETALTERGATRIVLIGHSLGAAAALRYGGQPHPAVAGLLLIAPGHTPEGTRTREALDDRVQTARAMVAAGQGDDSLSYGDPNSDNRSRVISVPARIFLSYYDPDGPANMRNNARAVAGYPMLWVAPNMDPISDRLPQMVWSAMANPPPRQTVNADHMGAVRASVPLVIDWLSQLK